MTTKEDQCGARVKARGKWRRCGHTRGHGGRHCYYAKGGGHRFFTETQARYWPVKPQKIDLAKAAEGWEERLKVPDELKKAVADETKATRVPVSFNYTGLNFDFLKQMAEIVPYADKKYTSFAQYTKSRMTGEASPINHLIEHARQYMMDEPYDHFDGDRGRHLVAIAYNAQMEWYYLKKFGPERHPLVLEHVAPIKEKFDMSNMMQNVVVGAGISAMASVLERAIVKKSRRRKKS